MKPLPTQPRWTTLAGLSAAVLALHLALLLGHGSPLAASPLPRPHTAPSTSGPDHAANAATGHTPSMHATMRTVRWMPDPTPPATVPQAVERSAPQPTPQKNRVKATAPNTEAHAEPNTAARANTPTLQAQPLEDASPSETPATVVALLSAPPPAPAENHTQAAQVAQIDKTVSPAQTAAQRSESRASALPPALPPASTQLLYDVSGSIKGLNYRASSTLDWTQADGRYNARLEMRIALLGSRVQTSTGQVTASGLSPERFSDKSRNERAAHFDRTRQTIRFSNNQPDAALQAGAQDRLSLFMQLAGLLQGQAHAYPVGHSISLQVAGTNDAEVWRFRVAESDTLTLPAGTLRARRLVREPREPRDSLIDIWFAPELAYLPVRIRITQENGDRVDQQLRQMPQMP